MRSSRSLSTVPPVQRNAVFACASETLKELVHLRAALEASALAATRLEDDLCSTTSTASSPSASQKALRLSLACVLLHDLADGRWLDRSQGTVTALLEHRSDLLSAYNARRGGSAAGEVQANGAAYLIFARVNTLRCTVDDAVSRLRSDGWSELPPLGTGQHGQQRLRSPLIDDNEGCTEGPSPHDPAGSSGGGDDSARGWRYHPPSAQKRRPRCFSRDALLPDVLAFPPGAAAVRRHPLVAEGCLMLQDRASCAAAHVLSPRRGSILIDACAAPGKKTAHLAALTANEATIFAFDVDTGRVGRLRQTLASTGATCVEAAAADFCTIQPTDPRWALAEAVLVDPSCSGSGTTFFAAGGEGGGGGGGRGQQAVGSYAPMQRGLILHAMSWPSVRTVVYSTCSIDAEENEGVVASVLAATAGEWGLSHALPGWPHRGYATRGLTESDASKTVRFDAARDLCLGFYLARFDRCADGGVAAKCWPTNEGADGGVSGGAAAADAVLSSCSEARPDLDVSDAHLADDAQFAEAKGGSVSAAAGTTVCMDAGSSHPFCSCVLENISALVRTRCAVPPAEVSDSDEERSGWPDECNGCGGVDDVACDEFIEYVPSPSPSPSPQPLPRR